ncbi:hypothetical protein CAEBREN_15450 [Caenorhabditis brenneri]|uniref:Uncharacterized protein n=1 Tax=Caenorhabditis brenneri TaxID=135651 RepID=G0MWQ4_CAEBE|nr:hypothetical protein CAEBREN_15450 [Caenorhabditis brenneri]
MTNVINYYDIPIAHYWVETKIEFNQSANKRIVFVNDKKFMNISGSAFNEQKKYNHKESKESIKIGIEKRREEEQCKVTINGVPLVEVKNKTKSSKKMSAITRKIYDIPVRARWYVVHVEVDSRTKKGTVSVEFKEKWQDEVENGRVARIEVPLEENGPTLMVIIDTDDDDHYIFQLYVDSIPLEEYMRNYKSKYEVWEIERLGAKSKFVYDKEAGHFYFKGVLIATPEKQRTMTGEKRECQEHNGYVFRVEHRIERGQWKYELHVNNIWNNNVLAQGMESIFE